LSCLKKEKRKRETENMTEKREKIRERRVWRRRH